MKKAISQIIPNRLNHPAWQKFIKDTVRIGTGIWHKVIFRNGIPVRAEINTKTDTYIFANDIEIKSNCDLCGHKFTPNKFHPDQKYCPDCQTKSRRLKQRIYMRKYRAKRKYSHEEASDYQ